jgi:hypothetical protein
MFVHTTTWQFDVGVFILFYLIIWIFLSPQPLQGLDYGSDKFSLVKQVELLLERSM